MQRWILAAFSVATLTAASVSTLIGDGKPGLSDTQVANPYGLIIGPDGGLYFCDLDNQRIRRLDLKTHKTTVIAGNGKKGYSGDGGPATEASLAAPHELAFDEQGNLYVAERDNHLIRKIDKKGIISTAAGTGTAGFAGDGGPASRAQLRQPHCVIRDRDGSLLICDIGNHRIRRLDVKTGNIDTWAGTGEQRPTPEGGSIKDSPLNGPRTLTMARNGDLYLSLREANLIYRIDAKNHKLWKIAGSGQTGFSGDGGSALNAKFGGGSVTGNAARLAGPKGLAVTPDLMLYIVDTESHAIRRVDLKKDVITTVLGTGTIGDGPESDPLQCKLNRPHAVLWANGVLYVADSEAHRIRIFRP